MNILNEEIFSGNFYLLNPTYVLDEDYDSDRQITHLISSREQHVSIVHAEKICVYNSCVPYAIWRDRQGHLEPVMASGPLGSS